MTKKKSQPIAQHPVGKTRKMTPLFKVQLFFRKILTAIKKRNI